MQLSLNENLAEMEQRTIPKFKNTIEKVKHILEKYPSTKGSDIQLLWRYYQTFEPSLIRINFKEFKLLMIATSPETITRSRRKIQEKGLFLPTDKTILKRRKRENVIREEIPEL